jgi:hypothetical protein
VDLRPAPEEPALAELRAARRRARISHVDWVDALYHAYLAAVLGIIIIVWVTGLVSDAPASAVAVARILDVGPAAVGLVVSVAIALGLRSGARGGPLALEEPEVTYVLLSPMDRGAALLGPALRQIRTQSFMGAAAGGVLGLCALRRLPGNPVLWLACGAATGALIGAALVGAALISSGRRWRPVPATLGGGLLIAISTAELFGGVALSPMSQVGRLLLWPLRIHLWALIGVVVLLALPIAGIYLCAGTSLEAAKRRAGLQAQLRFAATLYDVRTVILLRRQLTQEGSRSKPWLGGRSRGTGFPAIRRGWRGLMRWPATRVVRALCLGAIAGFAVLGVWRGAKPLIVVAGGALFVAALDAVEPLAQETDHPQTRSLIPLEDGRLNVRHLVVPFFVMLFVCAVGVLAILPFGDARFIFKLALAIVPSAALAAVCGAAISTVTEPPMMSAMQTVPGLELMGMQVVFLAAWPPAIAVIGLLPLFAALSAPGRALDPAAAAGAASIFTLTFSAFIVMWLLVRQQIRAWMSHTMGGTA